MRLRAMRKVTLHVRELAGANAHHIIEAAFKACGRALRRACEFDGRVQGVPSTKGFAVMAPSIVVVDYHKGNLSSVVRGLSRAGARAQASDSPEEIRAADAVVLPGGARSTTLSRSCKNRARPKRYLTPSARVRRFWAFAWGCSCFSSAAMKVCRRYARGFSGRCHGVEPAPAEVFEASSKRWTRGLGVLSGSCSRLESTRLKVPHVGWGPGASDR